MSKKRMIPAIALLAALLSGGALMAWQGKDAVSLAATSKNALLTADVVNTSFQGVGGRVSAVLAAEHQRVTKGQALMTLDPTDLDLQIAKLQVDVEQQKVKVQQLRDSLRVGADKISTQEKQARLGLKMAEAAETLLNQGSRKEDLQRQRVVWEAAQSTLKLAKANYARTRVLFLEGGVSQAEMDRVADQLASARHNEEQQRLLFAKMQAGPTEVERRQAHLSTEKARVGVVQAQQAHDELKNNAFNVTLLEKQLAALVVQQRMLQVQRSRLTLQAPVSGRITRVVPKAGENVSPGSPVIMIETDRLYYEVYVNEAQVDRFQAGAPVPARLVAQNKEVPGRVRYVTSAPSYASLRMSRDKGQGDISMFLVHVDVPRTPELLPGMTVEMKL